jgi:hypothetical protein
MSPRALAARELAFALALAKALESIDFTLFENAPFRRARDEALWDARLAAEAYTSMDRPLALETASGAV